MLERTPPSVSSDGTLTVWILPKSAVPDALNIDVEDLDQALRVTYSMTQDGWNRTSDQATETDPRLTLRDVPETPGAVTNTLEVTYVHGSDDDVMDPLVIEGEEVVAIERRAVPNEVLPDEEQLFDVIEGVWGKVRKNAPTANGKWTKTAKLFVRNVYEDIVLGGSGS